MSSLIHSFIRVRFILRLFLVTDSAELPVMTCSLVLARKFEVNLLPYFFLDFSTRSLKLEL